MTCWTVRAVNCGAARPLRDQEDSAIAKLPQAGPVMVGPLGLAGDEQADRVNHGGPDMAVHHYPHDHYAAWRAALGDHPLLGGEGAFGENISTTGLTEDVAALGDRYRLGSALVELSQARKPCWKLSHRFAVPTLTADVVRTARCGWYYRVIEAGQVSAGDRFELLDRPFPQWTVRRVFGLIVSGAEPRDGATLAELARLEPLSAQWRQRAAALAHDKG
ncbi:MAG: MOSC domain-containing protein [Sphingomonadaceae bacterium]